MAEDEPTTRESSWGTFDEWLDFLLSLGDEEFKPFRSCLIAGVVMVVIGIIAIILLIAYTINPLGTENFLVKVFLFCAFFVLLGILMYFVVQGAKQETQQPVVEIVTKTPVVEPEEPPEPSVNPPGESVDAKIERLYAEAAESLARLRALVYRDRDTPGFDHEAADRRYAEYQASVERSRDEAVARLWEGG